MSDKDLPPEENNTGGDEDEVPRPPPRKTRRSNRNSGLDQQLVIRDTSGSEGRVTRSSARGGNQRTPPVTAAKSVSRRGRPKKNIAREEVGEPSEIELAVALPAEEPSTSEPVETNEIQQNVEQNSADENMEQAAPEVSVPEPIAAPSVDLGGNTTSHPTQPLTTDNDTHINDAPQVGAVQDTTTATLSSDLLSQDASQESVNIALEETGEQETTVQNALGTRASELVASSQALNPPNAIQPQGIEQNGTEAPAPNMIASVDEAVDPPIQNIEGQHFVSPGGDVAPPAAPQQPEAVPEPLAPAVVGEQAAPLTVQEELTLPQEMPIHFVGPDGDNIPTEQPLGPPEGTQTEST